jgi:hypothetical protein
MIVVYFWISPTTNEIRMIEIHCIALLDMTTRGSVNTFQACAYYVVVVVS